MAVLCRTIREIENAFVNTLSVNKPIVMSEQGLKDFAHGTECASCDNDVGPFKAGDKCVCKVRYHNHMAGKYRGAAHRICNMHYNYKDKDIPVFFHNLKNMMLT